MKQTHQLLIVLSLLILPSTTMASSFVGRIIKLEGYVDVFKSPSTKPTQKGTKVKFQNKYYLVEKAKLGTKIENGNILRTSIHGKARVVFKNGDQFNIGKGTAYEINWNKKTKKKKSKSVINLMYGKFRAVVSKKGARNNMEVKTKIASMGVRGTDFFVEKKGTRGKAKLSVIRGSVDVALKAPKKKPGSKTKKVKKPKVIKVTQGFSAELPKPEEVEKPKAAKSTKKKSKINKVAPKPIIKLAQTTKQDLVKIQKTTIIKVQKKEEEKISKKLKDEIKVLEKKAAQTTLEDIKEHDPDLYAKIDKKAATSVDKINTQAVKKVFEKAPVAPAKPGLNDVEDLDGDVYDKYFSI